MPSFTNQVANLTQVGPVADLLIGPSKALASTLQAKGIAVPQPIRAVAMVDTGASGTVITPTIVQALGIQPVGVQLMSTPSTHKPVQVHEYDISLNFPNGVTVTGARAVEAPLGGQHIQCLIGRDVLQHGVLVYIGYINQFTLSP
jgi:predicted aspartyl protease